MKKYLQIFNFGIHDALTYRTRMVIWFLQSAIWISILPFIWLTIYGAEENIGGYSKAMMITYFFFVPILESLTVFHNDYKMQADIKEGTIVNFALRPLSYLWYQYCMEIGYKCIGIFPSIITMIIVYPLLKNIIVLPHISLQLLWLIPIILIGGGIGFLISALIGLVAFWTTRGEWAMHLWWMILTFVGGFVAPLEFFPPSIQTIISYTPFPLLIHTPISIVLGTVDTAQLVHQAILGIVWICVLGSLNSYLYRRGIRRVEGIGI